MAGPLGPAHVPDDVWLPVEEPDVTATELHVRVMFRLAMALGFALADRAGVFTDMFLRVEGREQVAPDVFVVPGASRGTRTVYRVPDEPVPTVTLEVLSPVNREPVGQSLLWGKRALLGRIGVPLHIEVDPDEGHISVWEGDGDRLVRAFVGTSFTSEALGGVRIETPAPGEVHVLLPDGRELLDADEELLRSERESERLRAKLREFGVDPDG